MDRDLDALLGQYRGAVDDPEASANFMPRLWQRIDARRTFAFRFRRMTQVFVGAAAALCLVIAGVSTILPDAGAPGMEVAQIHGTYLDVLAEAHPDETLAAQGIVRGDTDDSPR